MPTYTPTWMRGTRTINGLYASQPGQGRADSLGQYASRFGNLQSGFSSLYPGGVQGRGTAAGAFRQAGGPAQGFYTEQLGKEDPLGLLGNLQDYAAQRFSGAAQGVRGGVAEGLRQFDESYGGLGAGGVNPNARGFSRLLGSAAQAGGLGNVWATLQNAEQEMRQKALESTGAYRKGIADSLTGYARDVAGAQTSDMQALLGEMGINANLLTQEQQAYLQMILPFLQYAQVGGFRPGFSGQQFLGFLNAVGGQ